VNCVGVMALHKPALDRSGKRAILALREAAGPELPLAAEALREHPDPADLIRTGPWLAGPRHWAAADRQLRMLELRNITVVPVWQFPATLGRLHPLPMVLFVRGNTQLLQQEAVSIVGARAASRSAQEWAMARAAQLARAGTLVVSGGARGIDAAAHWGALRAGGVTLAYLGVSADRIYPLTNRRLFEVILDRGGALVSEHPPGAPTYKGAHALRNRFIAAHASYVVIVEATEGSGSLGTARWANRYGVPVKVSPLSVGQKRDGISWLMRKGWASMWDE